jgi:hypothetical protein
VSRFKEGDFYKIVGLDGYDMRAHEDYYPDLVGYTLFKINPILPDQRDWARGGVEFTNKPRLCTPDVLHASKKLIDAMAYYQVSRNLRVFLVHGTPVVGDNRKHGFREYDVIAELDGGEIKKRLMVELDKGVWDAAMHRPLPNSPAMVESFLKRFAASTELTCPNCQAHFHIGQAGAPA